MDMIIYDDLYLYEKQEHILYLETVWSNIVDWKY